MRNWARRLSVVPAAALLLVAFFAGTANAGLAASRVEVHAGDGHDAATTVCDFHLHFYGTDEDPVESGHWQIWSGDAVVLEGQYEVSDTEPEYRWPATGTTSLDNGSYTLIWDDEPIDNSYLELTFTVECEQAAPTGSVAPTDSAAPTGGPSEEPTGGVQPTESAPTGGPSEAPGGGVLPTESAPTGNVTGPGGTTVTLPPTDGLVPDSEPTTSSSGMLAVLGVLAVTIAGLGGALVVARRTSR